MVKREGKKISRDEQRKKQLEQSSPTLIFENLKYGSKGYSPDLEPFFNVRRGADSSPRSVNDLWNSDGLHQLNGTGTTLYSKHAFRYGVQCVTSLKLPDFSAGAEDGRFWFGGFENGSRGNLGITSFKTKDESALKVTCGGGFPPSSSSDVDWGNTGIANVSILNSTTKSFSDLVSNEHAYLVRRHRGFEEFYIDNELVAIIVHSNYMTSTWDNVQPYTIKSVPVTPPKAMNVLIEMKIDTRTDYTLESLTLVNIRVAEGDPTPPRSFPLYDEKADTLLTSGTYDTGTSYKSHPFPALGYKSKTLLFRADTGSTTNGLRIEVLTQEGNWRVYDSLTYSAGDLEYYGISADFPLVRIGYEPSADGASITDAELHLQ